MKKIAIMLFASATIFLASCGNGAEKAETSTDSTSVVVDSTATTVDSTATTVDTTKAAK